MRVVGDISVTRASIQIVVGKSLANRVSSNFLWSIVGEAAAKGAFFITNIYLARVLGVSGFGVFALAQTITTYLWLAVDLGIGMYGIREIAKDKENAGQLIKPMLTLRGFSGAVMFLLYTAALFLQDMPSEKRLTLMGCGMFLLANSFYSDWIFKGLEKFKFIALGSFVSSGVYMTSVFYLIKGSEDVVKTAFIWSLSYLFGAVSLIYFLYRTTGIKYRPSFDLRQWFFHLRESIYFSISGGLMAFYQYMPVLLVAGFFTSYEVGLFIAPYRLIMAIGTLGFMLPMAFYPVFAELHLKDKALFIKTHRNFQRVMLWLGVPAAALGTLFGKQIIGVLFGEQYIQSIGVFRMLIWLIPLYFLRYTYGSVLLATGFQRQHNIATFSGAITMGVMGVVLVPGLGITGGAVALLVSECVIIGAMALIFHKKLNSRDTGGTDRWMKN